MREPALPDLGYRALRRMLLLKWETEYVRGLLDVARGNVSVAAKFAKIDRKHLWRLMKRTGVKAKGRK